jgi:WD40 repeat protein
MNHPVHRHLWLAFSLLMVAAALALSAGCGDETVGTPVVAPKGKGVIKIKQDEKGKYVEKNGKRVSPSYVTVHPAIYSADGESNAYVARDKKNRRIVVLNDKPIGKPCAWTSRLTYDADKMLVYAAIVDGAAVVLRNGERVGGKYASTSEPALGPDGKSILFTAERDNKYFIVKDGKEQPAKFARVWSPAFSADGKSVIYQAEQDGKAYVVKDDTPLGGGYVRIEEWAFSPDGSSFAFIGYTGSKFVLVRDGAEVGEQYEGDIARGLTFASDGASAAFLLGEANEWSVMRDGQRTGKPVPGSDAGPLVLGPDSNTLFWTRDSRGWTIYKNGERIQGSYSRISLVKNDMANGQVMLSVVKGTRRSQLSVPW